MGEEQLHDIVAILVRIVESAGAIIIFVGALIGFAMFVAGVARARVAEFVNTRLLVARFLALGLEFQLAADILRTAVAPTFEEIGQLAAIAAIRTGLNYFLAKEIEAEEAATRAPSPQSA